MTENNRRLVSNTRFFRTSAGGNSVAKFISIRALTRATAGRLKLHLENTKVFVKKWQF